VRARQRRRGLGVVRQQRQETVHALRVETHARRQLPQEGAQLRPQRQDARRQEVRKRRAHIVQVQHVRDVARALDREHEALGCLVVPCLV